MKEKMYGLYRYGELVAIYADKWDADKRVEYYDPSTNPEVKTVYVTVETE